MRDQSSQGRSLAPWIIQGVGIILLAVVVIVWVRTERESTLLVGVGAALIWLTGGYDRAFYQLMRVLRPAPPDPPDEK